MPVSAAGGSFSRPRRISHRLFVPLCSRAPKQTRRPSLDWKRRRRRRQEQAETLCRLQPRRLLSTSGSAEFGVKEANNPPGGEKRGSVPASPGQASLRRSSQRGASGRPPPRLPIGAGTAAAAPPARFPGMNNPERGKVGAWKEKGKGSRLGKPHRGLPVSPWSLLQRRGGKGRQVMTGAPTLPRPFCTRSLTTRRGEDKGGREGGKAAAAPDFLPPPLPLWQEGWEGVRLGPPRWVSLSLSGGVSLKGAGCPALTSASCRFVGRTSD